ncbi:tRNA lysidine(34) synthetase TilS [Brucepastera parasyntrophica]|uniref:tRNA lysidine(34) synthetase TilS n=1 Tax=Brucepastera parasyntrophica TaxID=2880008 RepID=UPI00210DD6BB|nr:tRNA lysidine(34) synthetase TilS [Brucepastera parasyntrophica]ULQ60482.1 tRNA lysidine(34) synthetase TilS [Brucepastera parasyntrophica]
MSLSAEEKFRFSLENFLKTVKGNLSQDTVAPPHILAAVSGGADSIFLLHMLHRFMPEYGYILSAITVNHLLRPEAESSGDAEFTENICAGLIPPVPCFRVDFDEGYVLSVAADRKKGIEEAARFLRYREFDRAADACGAGLIMTGHNKNDQLETVLMRFFQGGGASSLSGIAGRRGRYVRPLLNITRGEIIGWLNTSGLLWREDASNADTLYLRNRIRRQLVPLLDEILPGWQRGVLAASEKAGMDDAVCNSLITAEWSRQKDSVFCGASSFLSMPEALRLRFLQRGLSELGVPHRVPSGFLLRAARSPERFPPESDFLISGSKLKFYRQGNSFFLKTDIVQNSKSGYLVYITSAGNYTLPFGNITVSGEKDAFFFDACFGPFPLPLIIRSRMGGDNLRTAEGKKKKLKKLMNDWNIHDDDREIIPVIEYNGEILAVYGKPLGYPDWYIKN